MLEGLTKHFRRSATDPAALLPRAREALAQVREALVAGRGAADAARAAFSEAAERAAHAAQEGIPPQQAAPSTGRRAPGEAMPRRLSTYGDGGAVATRAPSPEPTPDGLLLAALR